MIELNIKIYSFSELSDAAKKKAVDEHRHFLLNELWGEYAELSNHGDENDEEYDEQYAYISSNDEYVIENIEANEYYFYFDGSLCWTCTYMAGPKKGQTEIKIHGETYFVPEVTA